MANDAQSQTIPSWVEDDSYEVQSKVTYAINSGHPSPCSATQFKTFWKGLYDNVVVRSGKIQDNTHMDTMYLVDNQRGHHGESKIPSGINVTGETNVDGGLMVVYPVVKGSDTSDSVNIDWDGVCWIGNSGLDVYSHPFVFKKGSTVVSSTDDFDSVEKITSWKNASDYKKSFTNEYNPDSTTSRKHIYTQLDEVDSNSDKVSPTENEIVLQCGARGETFPMVQAGANDYVVSGAGMKYKTEFVKGSSNADVVSAEKWLVANGYGRVSKQGEWVTHTPKVIGSPRLFKECYNFTGGSRVATTLQDIDSGVFGLPTGHPFIEDNDWKQGELDYSLEVFTDEEAPSDNPPHFSKGDKKTDGVQLVPTNKQLKLQG